LAEQPLSPSSANQVLTHVRRLTDIGESFIGRKESEVMAKAIRERTLSYVQKFHQRVLEEMSASLSSDSWSAVPVDKVRH
jgi:hypothetical protein